MPPNVFIEAVAGGDGQATGLKWLIRVIRAGESINKNLYPASVLREAAPLFDGVRVFVKSDAEHLAGGGKSFQQLIGRLSEPRFVEANGGEIHAVLTLLATAGGVAAKIKEAYDSGMADLFGFSIDAEAIVKRRGKVREAARFRSVKSVDLIIEPGAGGELIQLLEAAKTPEENTDMKLRERMVEAVKAANKGALPDGLDIDNDEALEQAYREAVAELAAQSERKPGDNASERFDAYIRLFEARQAAKDLINDSGLPLVVQAKLHKQFASDDELTVARVQEAVGAEREVLASLTESGHVVGLSQVSAQVVKDRADKITEMLDTFFDRSKKSMSFRECYIEITGDRGITGLIGNCDKTRLREAAGGSEHFREAISSTTFADILGDSITRAMVRDYNALENYNDWRDLVDVVPVNNFRTQERTRMGGYGNLPAVAENGAYTALTSPGDEAATYAITKRGGTETISLETVANDDVGAIRKVPQRLAVAAKRTLFEFVLDFLRTNPTLYDTVALFHATHANLGTAALAEASFAAARLAMKQQVEADSSKKLGLILRHLYVPAELEETAFDLFVRGTNNDETFVQSRKPKVHVVDYWTDANNWYATADKMETPLIELGFYNGNEEPELFVQDLPTQGSLFSNDQIKYKIRHIYGGNVLDFRGFYGAVVA